MLLNVDDNKDVHLIVCSTLRAFTVSFVSSVIELNFKKTHVVISISRMFRQIVNRRSASFLRQADNISSVGRQPLHRLSFYSLDALSRRNTELSRPQVPPSKMYPLVSFARAMSSSGPESPEQKTGVVKKFKQMFKDYWYVLIPVHVATSVVW